MKYFLRKTYEVILSSHLPVGDFARPFLRILAKGLFLLMELMVQIRRIIISEPLAKSLCHRVGRGVFVERIPYISGDGCIELGDGVRISGKIGIAFNRRLFPRPVLSVGEQTFIGHNATFHIAKEIHIGRHCFIANSASFCDNDGHPLAAAPRRQGLPVPREAVRPVYVGDDVWVGRGAVILKGVRIGDRAVIGAGSLVASDVPADTVVGGNPARHLKALVPGAGDR